MKKKRRKKKSKINDRDLTGESLKWEKYHNYLRHESQDDYPTILLLPLHHSSDGREAKKLLPYFVCPNLSSQAGDHENSQTKLAVNGHQVPQSGVRLLVYGPVPNGLFGQWIFVTINLFMMTTQFVSQAASQPTSHKRLSLRMEDRGTSIATSPFNVFVLRL